MPANFTVEFQKAQEKYRNARTDEEKLIALQEMLSKAPTHKGAENLRKQIRQLIAQFRKKIEKKSEKKSKSGGAFAIKKEGIGQIAIVGLPNSGKSTFLNKIVGKKVAEVGDYPFTTVGPVVGSMLYHGAYVQLVECPAIVEGSGEGKARGNLIMSLIRAADGVVVLGKSEEEWDIVKKELEKASIILGERPNIEIKETNYGGIEIQGIENINAKKEDILSITRQYFSNALIIVLDKIEFIDYVYALNRNTAYKKALFVKWSYERNLEKLKEDIFLLLDKIIVFTKKPGEEPDYDEPLVLKKGSTIVDVAKKLGLKMKRGRVWGSTKIPGQYVTKEYELKNLDVVELKN